ncbi:hypothetical protein HMPREF9406_0893 [Clostridium sp. HGF2]|nr:hypothetical protein HMPREF9406_0893 [Clostridium sp. HGF2]
MHMTDKLCESCPCEKEMSREAFLFKEVICMTSLAAVWL